jgi:hypothetical protein
MTERNLKKIYILLESAVCIFQEGLYRPAEKEVGGFDIIKDFLGN